MTFLQIACSVLLGLRRLARSTELETLILPNHAGVPQHVHPADDEKPFRTGKNCLFYHVKGISFLLYLIKIYIVRISLKP